MGVKSGESLFSGRLESQGKTVPHHFNHPTLLPRLLHTPRLLILEKIDTPPSRLMHTPILLETQG